MITREKAKIMYPSFEDGNVCPSDVDKLIYKLFDQFDSQLSSNTLQLTCETCKYFSWNGRGLGQCHNCSPQCPGYTLTDFGCIFHTKDKK